MIFASKKVVCLVLLQLLCIIVNDVNGFPFPGKYIDSIVDTIASFFKEKVNCFGIHDALFKVLKLNDTNPDDVKFYFASQNKPNYTTVTLQNGTLSSFKNVDFDPFHGTVLISHGFLSSGNESWPRDMKDALLNYDTYNVIVVDWGKGSNTWDYIRAAASTRTVASQIAELFSQIRLEMRKRYRSTKYFGKIHFVGHSLGAHIVAQAANMIRDSQKKKPKGKKWIVNRITGLDPAQPCFVLADKKEKLDESDAEYVDVIHTNAQKPLVIGFGMPERIGYMDFYPNGGKVQIGCDSVDTSIWSHLGLPKEKVKEAICSHGRSHQFFIESIVEATTRNCTFISHPWHDQKSLRKELLLKNCLGRHCTEMGIDAINYFPREKGIFFTPTGHEEPYCTVKEIDQELIEAQLTSTSLLDRAWSSLTGK